jgi:molybdopterin-guanine dinucleotide biosynthesis protein A
MKAAGFVLVGGHSSRMGRDKALLPLSSRLLIEDIAAKVAAAAGSVALIGAPERYNHLGIECLPDLRPGMGPLAGIEAALESGRGELNLIVACDMPSLEADWLCRPLLKARETDALCVASRDASGIVHPLCAVYRSGCLPVIRRALDAGRLKLLEVIGELGASTLQIGSTVWNINTPQEWAEWEHAHNQ